MIFGTSMAILTCVYPPGSGGGPSASARRRFIWASPWGPSSAASSSIVSAGGASSSPWSRSGWPAIILTATRLRGEWDEARGEKFDAAGSVIFGLGLAALMYGFSRLPSLFGGGLVAAGLALLGAFILWEKRVAAPVLDVRLFRANRVFAFSNAAALINYSATSAVAFLLSLYLQYVKGLPPQKAGLVLVAQPVVMALFSPLAGKASDRIEPRIVASVGMAISSARPLRPRLPGPRDAHRLRHGRPPGPRIRVRPVLLAEHERRDVLGRAAGLWAWPPRPWGPCGSPGRCSAWAFRSSSSPSSSATSGSAPRTSPSS